MNCDKLIKILKSTSFDSNKNELLQNLISCISEKLTYGNIANIISIYSFDDEKLNALSIILMKDKNSVPYLSFDNLPGILSKFSYHEGKSNALNLIIDSIMSGTCCVYYICSILNKFSYDDGKVRSLKKLVSKFDIKIVDEISIANIIKCVSYNDNKIKILEFLMKRINEPIDFSNILENLSDKNKILEIYKDKISNYYDLVKKIKKEKKGYFI